MEIILKTNGIDIAGQELHFSESRDVSRAKLIGLGRLLRCHLRCGK